MSEEVALSQMNTVPEAVLRKRKTVSEHKLQKLARRSVSRRIAKKNDPDKYVRAEKLVKEYRKKEKQNHHIRRVSKNKAKKMMENKLLFVIRIRSTFGAPNKIKKVLSLMRLQLNNTGVFMKSSPTTTQMLRIVENYVVYGYPSIASTKALVTKLGYTKIDGKRTPMSSNIIIEDRLGDEDIICVEDLVDELFNCGSAFSKANKFLLPFTLNSGLGGFEKKTLKYVEGQEVGRKDMKIDEFIEKMM
eukprot:TRINITY_DN782090_c0_g1_i1.p1 TRINITY_DN782090_c0_g1~~TRINITY_DN782090_c0_g1_i1.p1  ORF type:complete len:276 (+),score=52.96 TRINITY_DN782090_c0_g1_i1:92-829(+)